jgi:hypothetical protein
MWRKNNMDKVGLFDYVSEESMGSKMFATVTIPDDIDETAFKTIAFSAPAFVPPLLRSDENGQNILSYDVTADKFMKLSLLNFGEITPVNFVTLMKNLTDIFTNCDDFFLNPLNFVIHEDYIYVKRDTFEVRLVYAPFEDPQSTEEEICKSIFKIVRQIVRPDREWSLVGSHLFAMSDETELFRMAGMFAKLYEEYAGAPDPVQQTPAPMQRPAPAPAQQVPAAPMPRPAPVPAPAPAQPQPAQRFASPAAQINQAAAPTPGIVGPGAAQSEKKGLWGPGQKEKKVKEPKKPKFKEPAMGKGGGGLFSGGGSPAAARPAAAPQPAPVAPPPPPTPAAPVQAPVQPPAPQRVQPQRIITPAYTPPAHDGGSTQPPPGAILGSGNTTQPPDSFAAGQRQEAARLDYCGSPGKGLPEVIRIELRNGSFNMGRIVKGRSDCDYAFPENTEGVSKLHAQIKARDGKYYIYDMNSTYGTYVEFSKIPPQQAVELEDGVKISFSTSALYEFRIEKPR